MVTAQTNADHVPPLSFATSYPVTERSQHEQ